MNWLETFRDGRLAARIIDSIKELNSPPIRLMEVCGTHTVAICQHGIRQLMPPEIKLTSGPGCPVCVTSTADIDSFIKAAGLDNAIITSYGDMLRVPGSRSTLQDARADGADIRTIYSSLDAIAIARENPAKEVIFLGIGFETTTPTVAAAIMTAAREGIKNFSVISAHKVVPPALDALLSDPEIQISGLICPGHVSIMIGANAYKPYAEKYGIPCVIAGFEPVDILEAIVMLVKQIKSGVAKVEIAYARAVKDEENSKAMQVMREVYTATDANWRGIGVIPGSGLKIRDKYKDFDAARRFDITVTDSRDPAGCACGDVLKSIIDPSACKLFGTACKPEHPVGPCMVSAEGSCAAFYKYQDHGIFNSRG